MGCYTIVVGWADLGGGMSHGSCFQWYEKLNLAETKARRFSERFSSFFFGFSLNAIDLLEEISCDF